MTAKAWPTGHTRDKMRVVSDKIRALWRESCDCSMLVGQYLTDRHERFPWNADIRLVLNWTMHVVEYKSRVNVVM